MSRTANGRTIAPQANGDPLLKAVSVLRERNKAFRANYSAQQIQQATGGGARAVLDLVGATPTVGLAMASAARGGHIVICGLMGGDLTLALPVIPMRPLTIQGSYVGTLQELQELVSLVKRSGMKPIPVHTRPLAQANEAMQDLHHGRVVGRTVLVP